MTLPPAVLDALRTVAMLAVLGLLVYVGGQILDAVRSTV